jgi:EmrB/QacA subfamily drug resistance transporter
MLLGLRTVAGTGASPRLLALIVACAMFMAQLDTSVVLVAVPQIARSFAVRPVSLSLGITSYILAQVVLLPGSGWLADRFGSRRIFILALTGFTATSALCGLSHTLPQFVVARLLQGVTAALMTPVGRIMLLQATRKSDLIAMMTISSVPMLIAPTLGPPVGGLIVTYLSWPWIFLLNVPVGLIGVSAALRFLPHGTEAARRPFDVKGFMLVGAAGGGVLLAFDQMSKTDASWSAGAGLLCASTGVGLVALRHLRKHPHPVISLRAARIRTFYVTTLGGGSLVRLPVRALSFVLPLLLQVVLGYGAVVSGFALLAMNGGDLLLKTVTTRTIRKLGFRRALVWSAATVVASVAVCAACADLSRPIAYWSLLGVLLVSGMARSLLFSGMGSLAFADVPPAQMASASVLWNLVQQMTNALGVSLAALLLNVSSRVWNEPAGHVSLRDCQIALLAMALVGVVSVAVFTRLAPDAGALVSGHRRPQQTFK